MSEDTQLRIFQIFSGKFNDQSVHKHSKIKMFICLFCSFAYSHKDLNLTTFLDGNWNSTVNLIRENGDVVATNKIIHINFTKEGTENSLIGALTGYSDNAFDVRVIIDKENSQKFTVEMDYLFEKHLFVASSEVTYGKRNMPYARGMWQNETQHFKLLVFDDISFELSVFRINSKITEVFRFTKTPKPQFPSIASAVLPPFLVGVVLIVFKLIQVHQYISDKEKMQKKALEKKNSAKDAETTKENQSAVETKKADGAKPKTD